MRTRSAISPDPRLFYDAIADQFDAVANAYDVERRLGVVFSDLLGGVNLSGHTLLDAGCGTGWFSRAAHERGAVVTALDIGPALLAEVRRKCAVTTIVGDVTALEFADNQFDFVVSSECIEHTLDPARAIFELVRVCRPGGLIALTCPNWLWKWSVILAGRLRMRPYYGLENWPGWFELRRMIRAAGADVVASRGIHLFPFQLRAFQPVLRQLDRLGAFLGPLFINQAVLARKRGE